MTETQTTTQTLETLYRRYNGWLVTTASHLVGGRRSDAEDLATEAWMKLMGGLERLTIDLDNDGQTRALLRKNLRFAAIDAGRKLTRTRTRVGAEADVGESMAHSEAQEGAFSDGGAWRTSVDASVAERRVREVEATLERGLVRAKGQKRAILERRARVLRHLLDEATYEESDRREARGEGDARIAACVASREGVSTATVYSDVHWLCAELGVDSRRE